jgi:dihydropteroate synthase
LVQDSGAKEKSATRCGKRYRLGARTFDFAERTFVMGILNVTPDSFCDGGEYFRPAAAIDRALRMVEEGADIIDVGGESTRPRGNVYGGGAVAVDEEEELRRVIPVIEAVARRCDVPISVDTWKSRVAAEALDSGAVMVNDIGGFRFDARMPAVVASHSASAAVMHTPARPWEMPDRILYVDVVNDVMTALQESVRDGERAGIEQMFVDPGLGFGKSVEENYQLIARLDHLTSLDYPVLVGISRKSFIGKTLQLPVEARLEGSLAALAGAILLGANVVRVHDVQASRRAAAVADTILRA